MDHRKKTQKLCSECGVVISGTYYNHDDGKVRGKHIFFVFMFGLKVFCASCQEEHRKKTQKICSECREVIRGTYYTHDDDKV